MILDALFGVCIFTAIVALLSVPFMPRPKKDAEGGID
jgi:hypothetical protein